jgi:putative SOS response-associated peptidase YedK
VILHVEADVIEDAMAGRGLGGNAGPIAFAGLWETWSGPNGEELDTACIVTTAANRLLAPIHDRMPVVIAPEAFDLWLDCKKVDAATAAALIAPAPANLFEAYEISTAVNRAANDSPALIAPLGPQPTPAAKPKTIKDDGQSSLF